ncbi:MAG TPA: hypothetical protein DDX92_02630 [Flavobacteriales bacterium]|jgi:hypothetical protein|nr:hypothetical protein [Flavobacteriales bacterium]
MSNSLISISILFTLLSLLLISCNGESKSNEQANTSSSIQNAADSTSGVLYKPSELALLMRQMHEELEQTGIELKDNPEPQISFADYSGIIGSTPTNPDEIDANYDAMARVWLSAYNEFKEEPSRENYNKVMETCVACHKHNCPGPIGKIEKLKF